MSNRVRTKVANELELEKSKLIAALRLQGITDERVLEVLSWVPREKFVPDDFIHRAYENSALAITEGQTISQPYIVALMTQELRLEREHKVLEVGTGSGYQTAVLSLLGGTIYTVERFDSLSKQARSILDGMKLSNIHYRIADGSHGWREEAPFDRIIVTAAAPRVPPDLFDQLAEGGILVIPVGDQDTQALYAYEKSHDKVNSQFLCSCRFVPLVSEPTQAAS